MGLRGVSLSAQAALLALTLVVCVATVTSYVRLLRGGTRPPPARDAAEACRRLREGGAVLQAELESEGGRAAADRERRRGLLRLLDQTRSDFRSVWEFGRLVAPTSQDPGFAIELMRLYLSFHIRYWRLRGSL